LAGTVVKMKIATQSYLYKIIKTTTVVRMMPLSTKLEIMTNVKNSDNSYKPRAL